MSARTRPADPAVCDCPRSRHQHGTVVMYVNHRCGCPDCRRAHAAGAARRRRLVAYGAHQPALVDAAGSRRRLQALMTVGWSVTALAEDVGITAGRLHPLVNGRQRLVSRTRHDRLVELYDRLWDVRPPEHDRGSRVSAERSRRHAARRGYRPPMWWDDDVIDDPARQRGECAA